MKWAEKQAFYGGNYVRYPRVSERSWGKFRIGRKGSVLPEYRLFSASRGVICFVTILKYY